MSAAGRKRRAVGRLVRGVRIPASLAFGLAFLPSLIAAADSLRSELLGTPVTADLGGETTVAVTGEDAFGRMAANAPEDRERDFFFGNRLFHTEWMPFPGSVKIFDGLGPTFNATACSGCHVRDGRGQPPAAGAPMESMLVRLSVAGPDGEAIPHPVYGGQLNDHAVDGVPAEGRAVIEYVPLAGRYGDGTPYTLQKPILAFADLAHGPIGDVMTSARVAPGVIGLGLLEAVPTETLIALADPEDADGDGISGRINWLSDRDGVAVPGRFGWKANVASLADQAAEAALNDMGLTTSRLPRQSCPASQVACLGAPREDGPEISDFFFDRLVTYVRTLGVPAQRNVAEPSVRRGVARFREFGCSGCHMPTLRSDAYAAWPELRDQVFHPFTDLLLHDMGEGLADGRPDGQATGSEWRTPPLWGLGLLETVNGHDRLLHDGRARGHAEAILWHGGEAEAAKEAFRTADEADRADLIAFLKSL